MYLQHFGLHEPPFSLTPDTSFFFAWRSHQEALNVLLVALRNGEGF
ncbi:MAG TPA: AAA family ATPase, partial [Gammaproteobacteria bacterium]